jgi:hypothetical protein
MSMLDDAIQAVRMGDKEEGRRLLEEMLEADESNENVWLWLTTVVDSDEDREVCLENALALNPNNLIARRSLDSLKAGNFDPAEIIRSAIKEEEPVAGATFLDEFRQFDDETETDDEADDLVMPSTMAKSKGKSSKQAAKKKGGGFKPNPRLILLAVFVLLIICALAGVALYNSMSGDLEPSGGQAAPETPAGGGEVQPTAEPAATDTPAVPPTDTPAPTRPPLELPTAKPTEPATPTATPVVAPTVGSQ